jgi:hypothetical protein
MVGWAENVEREKEKRDKYAILVVNFREETIWKAKAQMGG